MADANTSAASKAASSADLPSVALDPVPAKDKDPHSDDEELLAQLKGRQIEADLKLSIMKAYVSHHVEIEAYLKRAKGGGDRWHKMATWLVNDETISKNWIELGHPIMKSRLAINLKNDVARAKALAKQAVSSGVAAASLKAGKSKPWWADKEVQQFFMCAAKIQEDRSTESGVRVAQGQAAATGSAVDLDQAPIASVSVPSQVPVINLTTDAEYTEADLPESAQSEAIRQAGSKRKRSAAAAAPATPIGSAEECASQHSGSAVLSLAASTAHLGWKRYTDFNDNLQYCTQWCLKNLHGAEAADLVCQMISTPRAAIVGDTGDMPTSNKGGVMLLRLIPILRDVHAGDDVSMLLDLRNILGGSDLFQLKSLTDQVASSAPAPAAAAEPTQEAPAPAPLPSYFS